MKKTLVLGASENPARVSYDAIRRLTSKGHEVVAVGLREATIFGVDIQKGQPQAEEIDTITLYLNPERQKEYYDYILGLQPKRIIFNPGTENFELLRLAKEKGIETEFACTLVMLSVGQY
ncbi:MAG: CoA-binding protein [Haliscomenobacter sp.]|uniref:CoA-binding protein n=1 Tax=Haliscomenobacter sp. TaxID=2717303 RepID=UPI0029B50548|nr:CoA-binding protein [Haliscomenobacter sp.]MDX2072012.1 CoA-binding protein [Haliscomenobacter sp.]